ncbi:MAG: ATP synthase F0 subunit B [Proteobacteria bacterium]|nr:ATP synthase F0 subunit B [Pseudomonadota bacterium]
MITIQCLAFESPALDLDVTMFIQLGIFVLLLLALNKYVLKPYFRAYDKRYAMTEGAREDAKALQAKASESLNAYESERQKVYAEVETERKHKIAEANEAASKVVEAARAKIQSDLSVKQRNLELELESARQSASSEIDAISRQIADKILV